MMLWLAGGALMAMNPIRLQQGMSLMQLFRYCVRQHPRVKTRLQAHWP